MTVMMWVARPVVKTSKPIASVHMIKLGDLLSYPHRADTLSFWIALSSIKYVHKVIEGPKIVGSPEQP